MTNILDYMENRNREVLKTNVKQNVREFSARQQAARKMSRRAKNRAKVKEQKIQEPSVSWQKEERAGNNGNQEQQDTRQSIHSNHDGSSLLCFF